MFVTQLHATDTLTAQAHKDISHVTKSWTEEGKLNVDGTCHPSPRGVEENQGYLGLRPVCVRPYLKKGGGVMCQWVRVQAPSPMI